MGGNATHLLGFEDYDSWYPRRDMAVLWCETGQSRYLLPKAETFVTPARVVQPSRRAVVCETTNEEYELQQMLVGDPTVDCWSFGRLSEYFKGEVSLPRHCSLGPRRSKNKKVGTILADSSSAAVRTTSLTSRRRRADPVDVVVDVRGRLVV